MQGRHAVERTEEPRWFERPSLAANDELASISAKQKTVTATSEYNGEVAKISRRVFAGFRRKSDIRERGGQHAEISYDRWR